MAKSSSKNQQQLYLIGGVVAVAVIVAVAAILISGSGTSGASASSVDYSSMETTQTDDGGWVIGSPDAPVTIVEFADFRCGHCQDYKSTVNQILEELVATGQARFEFRAFPVIQPRGGATSDGYANMAHCAGTLSDEGAVFWQAHDMLYSYAEDGTSNSEAGRNLASEFDNFSYAELLECMEDNDFIQSNQQLARSVGVSGTPAMRFRGPDGELQTASGSERGGIPFSRVQSIVQTYSNQG